MVMPHTLVERLLALSTVAGALAFATLAVANWSDLRPAAPAPTAAPSAAAAVAPVETEAVPLVPTVASSLPEVPRVEERPPAASPPPRPTLVIAARRGPSWLEARAGGPAGEQLFFGILDEGGRQTFDRLPVWIRLGAVANVAVMLAGGDIAAPSASSEGVTEFLATADGVASPSAP